MIPSLSLFRSAQSSSDAAHTAKQGTRREPTVYIGKYRGAPLQCTPIFRPHSTAAVRVRPLTVSLALGRDGGVIACLPRADSGSEAKHHRDSHPAARGSV
jgi:hypothetical protein